MIRKCANCGRRFIPLDGRYKYCSEECALEGHRKICRENYRRYYVLNHEKELARNRQSYWAKK